MKVLTLFLLLLPFALNGQVSVHIADSPLSGNAGVEYRFNLRNQEFAISSSYRPAKCFNLDWFHSFSGAVTYFYDVSPIDLFVSAGIASKCVYRDKFDYLFKTSPATVFIVGMRFYLCKFIPEAPKRLSIDFGGGVFASRYGHDLTGNFAINVDIIK